MRRAGTRTGRPSPAELEGFRTGIAHGLSLRRARGEADLEGETALAEADRAIAQREYGRAESILAAVDDRLRESEPETELSERPRGLVRYVGRGPPGDPVPLGEDRLNNRILLATRLATLERGPSDGPRSEVLEALVRAAEALRSGDRASAEALCEEAWRRLDRREEPDPGRPRPAGRRL